MGIRRLYFDIEVSPNIGFFWQSGYKLNIGYENIIKERAIICICYKWADQDKVYSLQWDEKQNDKKMLADFIKVANQADELVAQNGDNFDIKWIRTRCLFHGISMMPRYETIDTLKVARSQFKFNSNRLDYMSKFMGRKGKIQTSFDLWKDITLKNCKKSMREMVTYCKQDVLELEYVFQKLNPHIKPKTSIADYKCDCPECGSSRVGVNAYKISASGTKYVQLQCKDCGKYHKVNAASYGAAVQTKAADQAKGK